MESYERWHMKRSCLAMPQRGPTGREITTCVLVALLALVEGPAVLAHLGTCPTSSTAARPSPPCVQ